MWDRQVIGALLARRKLVVGGDGALDCGECEDGSDELHVICFGVGMDGDKLVT